MTDPARRQAYLDAMGIARWVPRAPGVDSAGADAARAGRAATDRAGELTRLAREVAGCTLCELCRSRSRTVFGVGSPQAEWMVVGEGPGEQEDRKGEPFVGPAGKLLDNMLRAAGYQRGEVYIANIVKCRPPRNRDPKPEEVASCFPYLRSQIEIVRPRLIVALGRVAAQNLLGVDTPLGRMRGKVYQVAATGTPVVVTYHPAYLLRSPQHKGRAWEDLCLALRVAREEVA